MKHSNVIAALTGTVWASTENQLNTIKSIAETISFGDVSEMRSKFNSEYNVSARQPGQLRTGSGTVRVESGVAIVPIEGVIAPKLNLMMSISGGTSAELLESSINTLAADDNVHTIVLNIDSDGGAVSGLASASAAIRGARKKKRVYALANDNMNSAAYWLGSAAEKIFVTPTSLIGSIGVLGEMRSVARKNDAEGIDIEVIRSTPLKAKPNSAEPLDDAGRSTIQTMVNSFHELFVSEIAVNRQISLETAKQMANGTVKVGADAIEAGLADGVSSLDGVVAQARDEDEAVKAEAVAVEQIASANADLSESLAQATAQIETLTTDLAAAREEIAALKSSTELNASIASIEGAASEGKLSAAKANEMIAQVKAGEISAANVDQIIGFLEPGAATPQGSVVDENKSVESTGDTLAPLTEREKAVYRLDPGLRKKYNL